MRSVLLRSVAGAAIMSLLFAAGASANTITVNSTADTTGDISVCTLRDAIQTANGTSPPFPPPHFGGCADPVDGADTIDFSLGSGAHTIQLDSVLPGITQDVTIHGPGASSLTVRGELGTEDYHVFTVTTPSSGPFPAVTLQGMTVTHGAGGILDDTGASLTLNDVTVSANTITSANPSQINAVGAGIADTAGATLTINNSTVTNNTVTATSTDAGPCCGPYAIAAGAAIDLGSGGNLSITGSTISGNQTNANANQTASASGAIFNDFGLTTITRSTVSGNTATATVSEAGGPGNATARGGALVQQGAGGTGLTLDGVTVTGNTAATVTGSAGGTGSAFGGGILLNQTAGGTLSGSATGSTISGNTVSETGPGTGFLTGADVDLNSTPGSVFSFQNTIIANGSGATNCVQDSDGAFSSLGYNIDSGSSCIGAGTTGDQPGTNPQLGSLLDNGGRTETMAPGINSPAVDAGSASGDTVDQRALPRTFDMDPTDVDDGTDIGSFEQTILKNPDPPSIDFGPQVWGTSTPEPVSLLNRTGNSLTPAALAFSGLNPGDFLLNSDNCSNQPLVNNFSCTANAVFHPVSAGNGPRSASLSFPTDVAPTASVGSVALTGSATEYISLVPTPKNFGSTEVGTPTGATQFTVTNAGPGTSGTLAAALTGANVSQFGITHDNCTGQTLGNLATCTVSVRFAPTSAGAKSARLNITGTPGGTQFSALTGTAIGPPPPTPTPTPTATPGPTGQRAAALKKCKKKKNKQARNKCKKKAKKLPA